MANEIKCILLDIDNTLTNSNEEISKEISDYFTEISKQYFIILVTGRTNYYAVEKSKLCNASSIVISDNGAVIYDYSTDKVLFSKIFNIETLRSIWSISQEYNIDCVFNTLYNRYRKNNFINNQYLKNNNIGINTVDEIKEVVTQIVLLSDDKNKFSNCLNKIEKINDIKVSNKGKEKDGRYFADLNLINVSKGKAIEELYKILNINRENSICFGDSMNDISMFQASGCKVAMKNASNELKEMADFVTEYSNNENGVIEFLKKYLQ